MKDATLIIEKHSVNDFWPLCAMRARTVAFNAQTVDLPVRDDWKHLLKSAGVRKVTFSGAAVFANAGAAEAARQAFSGGSWESYLVFVPGLGKVSGLFKVAKFALAGDVDGAVAYDLYLDSCADVALAAEA